MQEELAMYGLILLKDYFIKSNNLTFVEGVKINNIFRNELNF